MRLQLYYPFKPYRVNQTWGILNPIYQQFGFSRHNGIDLQAYTGQGLYSPMPGTVIRAEYIEKGAGNLVTILSDIEYDFDDGIRSHVLIDFMHNKQVVFFPYLKVMVGSVLAFADNTGFSTGPHSHMGVKRVRVVDATPQTPKHLNFNGKTILGVDINDANNTIDPTPYWNGIYAEDRFRVWLHELLKGLK